MTKAEPGPDIAKMLDGYLHDQITINARNEIVAKIHAAIATAVAQERDRCVAVLRANAAYVRGGKRPNQVDRHTADVLDLNADQIERATIREGSR